MSESGFVHKQIQKIMIDNHQLYISFCFKDDILKEQQATLLFLQRSTGRYIKYPFKQIALQEGYGTYETTISLKENDNVFHQNAVWDLYVSLEGEEEKKYRLISNRADVELNYCLFPNEGTMFYPYTTNKGNISCKTTKQKIVANIEEAYLSKEGSIRISGYGFDPNWGRNVPANQVKNLIITNNINEEQHKVKLESTERKDLTEKYGTSNNNFDFIGFEGKIDLNKYINNDSLIYYRFYLEIQYEENGETKSLLSPRLKFQSFNPKYLKQKAVAPSVAGKKKYFLKSTAKKQFLSIRVSDYNAKQELKSRIKGKLRRLKRSKKAKLLYQLAFKLLGKLPSKKNTIVFESFLGKQYSCNPRAIYEYIQEHHPEYKLYWSVDKRFIQNFDNRGIDIVPRFSVKWLFTMSRAQYWVSNSRLPLWIPKPKYTTYLQTWHGTPLKRLAADMDEVHMPGTNTEKYKKNFLMEASNWDYLISPNQYSSEIFARAFGFDKTMIESGYPRNDALFNDNTQENLAALKEKFGLPLDKKVILYAPTWRDDQFYGKGKYKFDLELDLNKLREELGDEYIIVLRMHYLVAENLDLTPYSGFAYDFSNYEDIRELYLISDLLITDYSSVFFDYGNLRRPMIFYVYDIDSYRDKLRGFYFDFEKTAPGPLAKTTDEVIDYIKQASTKPLDHQFDQFYQQFCYLEDGEASKRVVEEVFLKK
ncbi:CDP-glycerol glycerophosphotransferase family protein [Niallia sp. 03091]|uniref:CDP-glycerol glycerophosphotransferase family protein n=1 Tax=unclassified Niallia TaxID=2837522 RepID=UPI0040447572